MSVVKINAITVPAGRGDELVARFAARAGDVEQSPGFEEFQLLRPNDDRDVFLVYTRWRSEEDFESWRSSMSFAQAHTGTAGGEQAGGHPGGGHPGAGGHPGGGHPGGHPGGGGPAGGHPGGGPVASASELWSFDVVEQTLPARPA
jgi:heme-degrading monooxygenase HmoA